MAAAGAENVELQLKTVCCVIAHTRARRRGGGALGDAKSSDAAGRYEAKMDSEGFDGCT